MSIQGKYASNILGFRKLSKNSSIATGTEPKRLRIAKKKECPIDGCKAVVIRLKQHVVTVHEPKAYGDLHQFSKITLPQPSQHFILLTQHFHLVS